MRFVSSQLYFSPLVASRLSPFRPSSDFLRRERKRSCLLSFTIILREINSYRQINLFMISVKSILIKFPVFGISAVHLTSSKQETEFITFVSVDLLAKRRLSRKFYARSNFIKDKNRITSLILFQSPKFVRKSILPQEASLGVIQPLPPFPLNFHKQDLRPPLPNALHYNTRTKEVYQEMMCIC